MYDGYLQRIREITKENDVLLIADEVMSGWGLTGRCAVLDLMNNNKIDEIHKERRFVWNSKRTGVQTRQGIHEVRKDAGHGQFCSERLPR